MGGGARPLVDAAGTMAAGSEAEQAYARLISVMTSCWLCTQQVSLRSAAARSWTTDSYSKGTGSSLMCWAGQQLASVMPAAVRIVLTHCRAAAAGSFGQPSIKFDVPEGLLIDEDSKSITKAEVRTGSSWGSGLRQQAAGPAMSCCPA